MINKVYIIGTHARSHVWKTNIHLYKQNFVLNSCQLKMTSF